MKKIALLVLPALLLGACSENIHSNKSLRNVSSHKDVSQKIHKGMTQDQVRQTLGEPVVKNRLNDQSIWQYWHRETDLGSTAKVLSSVFTGNFAQDEKILNIFFNNEGIVTNFTFQSEDR